MANTFKDTIPDELITHVTAICGERGVRWFDELPEIIAALEQQWNINVGKPFPGVEYNFVAEAEGKNRTQVVLKIAPPYERAEIHGEAKYLRTRNGNGAIEVLSEDRERKAIMLERALPGEALFDRFKDDPAACVEPAIEVLRSIIRPKPVGMSDVDTLDNWFNNFRRYKETDFPANYADKAFEIYERLSTQAERIYYLHGDFHPGNIVAATRTPFLAIDPKGIVGHIGYDIAVFLNSLHWWQKKDPKVSGLLSSAVGQFANAFGIAEIELREWAYASMVIGAWWNYDDMPELYNDEVALADIWRV